MCVLTYLPLDEKSFLLTSSRDEHKNRLKAIPPKPYLLNRKKVIFPQDVKAGGTWFATSSLTTLCLLNGAFENHIPKSHYRQSRGRIIPDFFQFKNVEDFLTGYNFYDLEPFTLIIISHENSLCISELRWTGEELFFAEKNCNKPYIWSSATLYSVEMIHQREEWFENWLNLQQQPYQKDEILDFHLQGGIGDGQNDLRLNRETHATQTIIQIEKYEFASNIKYYDLENEQLLNYRVL